MLALPGRWMIRSGRYRHASGVPLPRNNERTPEERKRKEKQALTMQEERQVAHNAGRSVAAAVTRSRRGPPIRRPPLLCIPEKGKAHFFMNPKNEEGPLPIHESPIWPRPTPSRLP